MNLCFKIIIISIFFNSCSIFKSDNQTFILKGTILCSDLKIPIQSNITWTSNNIVIGNTISNVKGDFVMCIEENKIHTDNLLIIEPKLKRFYKDTILPNQEILGIECRGIDTIVFNPNFEDSIGIHYTKFEKTFGIISKSH